MARLRARAAVAPLPRRRRRLPVRAYLPSRQSLLVGAGLLALAAGAYAVARETSAFAVTRIEVRGSSPTVDAQVRHAAARVRGRSLLALDGAELLRRVDALPTVVAASYDRAFPHTLRLVVVPEERVAVVRQGANAWLLSARGRVMAVVAPHAARALPRIWVPRRTNVVVGGFLPADHAAAAARALGLARRFPAHIAFAAVTRDGLTFRLRDGLEVRLGDPTDVRLKLAVASRALGSLPPGATYLDVSVPNRPVADGNSQLSG